jgi:S-adenosyl methyltransferase
MDRHLRVFANVEALQADFPGFVIWGETIRGRFTYVAQALDGETNPRVVTSTSLDRLRSSLEEPVAASDPAKPNVARVYDYLLGGTTNFAADRAEAARLVAEDSRLPELARDNRAFLTRAVTYAADRGVRQFIDVGAGLPTSPSTHETAETVLPDARVAYVDNDPVVISHARSLLPNRARIVAVPGDLRDPAAILHDPALTSLIDLAEPVCVLLVAVLHFLDASTARHATATFTKAMAPSSYLVLSVGQAAPGRVTRLRRAYTAARLHHHSRDVIEGFCTGLDLLPPGLTDACSWAGPPQPTSSPPAEPGGPAREATVICGVGRKPDRPLRRGPLVTSGPTGTGRSGLRRRSTTFAARSPRRRARR